MTSVGREKAQGAWNAPFGCRHLCGSVARLSRAAAVALAIAAPLGLVGCGASGFQPLYATGSNGQRTDARLAELDIGPVPGRMGQRLRNELIFERSAGGPVQAATKRLEIKLTESIFTTLIKADGNSTGQTFQVEVVYRVLDIKTAKVEHEGRSVARINFERVESVYANVRAREDAENRATRTIASDMKTRLAVHLSRT
jgi:LPS-assembly lipoprotein